MAGTSSSVEARFPWLYGRLRQIASQHLRRERAGHTLQTIALAHKVYRRLARMARARWTTPEAFCTAAASTIRRVLVDHARARARRKRGGADLRRVALDFEALLAPEKSLDLCDLDEALVELEAIDPRRARVVELRFFCGLSDRQIAAALDISERTARTDWNGARLWLRRRMVDGGAPGGLPRTPRPDALRRPTDSAARSEPTTRVVAGVDSAHPCPRHDSRNRRRCFGRPRPSRTPPTTRVVGSD